MRKAIVFISVLGLCLPLAVSGQEFAKVGTSGAQFLKIGIGARAVAMSEAYVAVANDASAIFWNPAGLVLVEKNDVHLSHTEWVADIGLQAAGFAKTLEGIGTVGLSFCYLGSGDMNVTTVEQPQGTGEKFSYSDLMLGVSFARWLTDKFAVGGNVKIVREDFGVDNPATDERMATSVWGVDIGTLYFTGYKSLRMGMSIQNFGPELSPPGEVEDFFGFDPGEGEFVTEEATGYRKYHMPLTFRVGLAMDLLDTEEHFLTACVEADHPNDNMERLNMGAEYWLMDLIAFRAGYMARHDSQTVSFGAGFKFDISDLGDVRIDYAYSDLGILEGVHRFSMGVGF
ncbi:MAG: PorV/PorQ family protein [Gemmatimonadota bacterium]|nr:MAG: PorV/PorQ family protein [Gemmatimonadota bacterium]